MVKLTETEKSALLALEAAGGARLVSSVPERTAKEVAFGDVVAGHAVYKRLEKRGLCYYSQEDPVELPGFPEGFTFTSEIYLTDDGAAALRMAG